MRVAGVTFGMGSGLFAAAAAGLVGTWALAASTVAMLAAGLVAVIVMKERDHAAIEGLYPASSDPLDDAVTDPGNGITASTTSSSTTSPTGAAGGLAFTLLSWTDPRSEGLVSWLCPEPGMPPHLDVHPDHARLLGAFGVPIMGRDSRRAVARDRSVRAVGRRSTGLAVGA